MIRYCLSFCVSLFLFTGMARAVDAGALFDALRSKVFAIKDYVADVKMKVDVTFMQVPELLGKLYYKAPDKIKLEREGGISILPKKNDELALSNLIPTGKVTVIDAGTATINGKLLRVIKVIPEDDQGNIVLTKIWIDEANVLAMRTETTTHNDGTVIMALEYGKNAANSLPDKATIYIDLKDYKMPKGVTMDYDNAPAAPQKQATGKVSKGAITIQYLDYKINTGLSDDIFIEKQ